MEGDAKDAIGDRVVNHSPARGERDMRGLFETTPLESWSMGKSVTATLMGVLIRQGTYALNQPAPMPEWQKVEERIADLKTPSKKRILDRLNYYGQEAEMDAQGRVLIPQVLRDSAAAN